MNEHNTIAVVSFTFDDIIKDMNYDKIFLFILSYEYGMNFNTIMTLFNFSSDIFWTYINTLRPMLKLGDRKASMLKHSARKIYFKLLGSQVDLSAKEQEYIIYLMQYINDSFTNGETCIHCSVLENFPYNVKGTFTEHSTGKQVDTMIIKNQDDLYKYIDNIHYILINGEWYEKTTRVEYLIEKYYGDLNSREIRRKSVREIIEMMDSDAIDLHNKELTDKADALLQHRVSLVYRNGKV